METLGVLADQPELVALGTLAGVAPSKMALAFNDPDNFFTHLSLEELERLVGAGERLAALQQQLAGALEQTLAAVNKILEAKEPEPDAD